MTEATLIVGLEDTGLPRRSLILRSLRLAGGAMATVPLVALVGAMIKKPGDQLVPHAVPPEQEAVPAERAWCRSCTSDWRRVGPDDIEPGGIATVFPGVRSETVNGYRRRHRRVVAHAADPAAAGPEGQGRARARPASAGRRRTPSTSRSPRSARTPAARRRCTSSRPAGCCARATSRSSRCSRTPSRCSARPPAACRNCRSTSRSAQDGRQYFVARVRLQRSHRPRLLGAAMTSHAPHARATASRARRRARPASGSTSGSSIAGPMRTQLNKVFPDHWSFMMGEIALYSFIILLLTGTYLTFFFDPSMAETSTTAGYVPMQRHHDVAGVRVDAEHHLRRPRRPDHPADPPLGGAAVPRRDAHPHVPGVLHRRVPQAA